MAAVSSRYARALVEVVLEQKVDADDARQQLNSIAEAVRESSRLAPGVGVAGSSPQNRSVPCWTPSSAR